MLKSILRLLFIIVFCFSPILSRAQMPPVPVPISNDSVPSIKITYPAGGETFKLGEKIKIIWNSTNLPTDTVLSISFGAHPLNSEVLNWGSFYTKNTGSATFFLPVKLNKLGGSQYSLPNQLLDNQFYFAINGIYQAIGLKNEGAKSNLFNVIPCSYFCTPISIKVNSPNAGDVFNYGDTIPIKWSTENIPKDSDVLISLSAYPPSGVNASIDTAPVVSYVLKTKNTGSTSLVLPSREKFGVLANSESRIEYSISILYYYSQDGHLSLGSTYPNPLKSDVFTNSVTDAPYTDNVAGQSDFFKIISSVHEVQKITEKDIKNSDTAKNKNTITASEKNDSIREKEIKPTSVVELSNGNISENKVDSLSTSKVQKVKHQTFGQKVRDFFMKFKFW